MSSGAIAVIGDAPGSALDLAHALAAAGEETVFIGPPGSAVPPGGPDGGLHIGAGWDRSDAASFAAALSGDGLPALRAAVWAWAPPSATTPAPFDTVDEDTWVEACEGPIRQYLSFLQGAHRYFAGRPGSLVLLVPNVSLLGSPPGLVAWMTASEGQRTFMKSAARNWGPVGLRSYALACTPALLVAPGSGSPGASRLRVGLPPQALPDAPSWADVARTLTTITGPGFESVTGSTIGVDGGQWMVP